MRSLSTIMLAAAVIALPVSASALTAEQTVQKETTVVNPDGTTQIKRMDAAKIVPGERVVYTLNYMNDDADSVTDIVLTMPIPDAILFAEGSADKAGARVTYSADDGQTFSIRQTVMMMDAAGNVRAASANELTHVRWTVPGPIASGTAGSLSFSGKVK